MTTSARQARPQLSGLRDSRSARRTRGPVSEATLLWKGGVHENVFRDVQDRMWRWEIIAMNHNRFSICSICGAIVPVFRFRAEINDIVITWSTIDTDRLSPGAEVTCHAHQQKDGLVSAIGSLPRCEIARLTDAEPAVYRTSPKLAPGGVSASNLFLEKCLRLIDTLKSPQDSD